MLIERKSMSGNVESVELTRVIRRQLWLIVSCTILGVAAALVYYMNATVWYESTAKVMVSQMESGLATGVSGAKQAANEILNEDTLANRQFAVVQLYCSLGRNCLKQVFRMPSRQMAE